MSDHVSTRAGIKKESKSPMHSIILFPMLQLLLLLCSPVVDAQTYCQCAHPFQYDPSAQCFSSGAYGVENSCYNCPVVNGSGIFNFCDSLYRLGYGVCGQSGALAAMQAACTAFGGNINDNTFGCFSNAGANRSQVIQCNITLTEPPVPVNSPSHAASLILSPLLFLSFGIFAYVF
jgi:hypothetical protein